MKTKPALDHLDLYDACQVVERFARSIGKDCQVIFTSKGVEVAPLSWAGSETADNLFLAIQQALKSVNK